MSIHSAAGPAAPGVAWDDLRFPFTRDKQGQNQKPDFDFTNLGLLFPQNDPAEIIYLIVQLPHSRLAGSDLHPHIHFVQAVAQQPVFKLDYRWYVNGGDPTGAFTTLTANTFSYAWAGSALLQRAKFPVISGVTGLSTFMDVRLYRDDNVVAGDVLTKEFDIHYQIDSNGSRLEHTK